MSSKYRFAQADRIKHLQEMLTRLEGEVFGQWLLFSTIGDDLCFNIDGGWQKIRGFSDFDELRVFAEDANKATLPARRVLVEKIKQELAKECLLLGANEVGKPPVLKE